MALLDLLGRRWALRVLWELRGGPAPTFRELQSRCGDVSSSVLAQRLHEPKTHADGMAADDEEPSGNATEERQRAELAVTEALGVLAGDRRHSVRRAAAGLNS